ncbi:MAG: AzlC family ABC transporter permease [Candidatus Promineifilaceae bacterium]
MFKTSRAAFLGGMQAIAPVLLGAIPFGLVVGVISAENHLSTLQMLTFSVYVFAGLSQLVAFQLYEADAALWVIVLSAAIVNLRLVIYSASIAPYFRHLSTRWKLLLAYLLVDQGYALSIAYYDNYPDAPHKHWYYAGTGALITVGWLSAVITGFFVGAVIPDSWSLNFIVPVMFLGLLVPAIKSWPYLAAAVVAATVALLTVEMPHNLGLVTAILSGMMTGAFLDRDEQGAGA